MKYSPKRLTCCSVMKCLWGGWAIRVLLSLMAESWWGHFWMTLAIARTTGGEGWRGWVISEALWIAYLWVLLLSFLATLLRAAFLCSVFTLLWCSASFQAQSNGYSQNPGAKIHNSFLFRFFPLRYVSITSKTLRSIRCFLPSDLFWMKSYAVLLIVNPLMELNLWVNIFMSREADCQVSVPVTQELGVSCICPRESL